MSTHQNHAESLAVTQNRLEERRLRSFFLRCMGALKCRPEPRHVFDDQARADADERRVLHPGHRAVDLCRILMHAAVETRDLDTINAMRLEIAHYFDEMKASALREVLPYDATSIEHVLIGFHRQSAEALTAAAVACAEGSEAAREHLLREVREADDEGERLEAILEAEIARRSGERHLKVAR